ncbi:MAG TPA: DsbA family protein [Epsilonproteobacteria bacterium]|nr:DsbA family protein [Campylobacterota bacterium]
MSLTLKLLMSILIVASAVNAEATLPTEKQLKKFLKKNVVRNPQVKLNSVTVIEQQTHKDLPGWDILLLNMELTYQKKEIKAPELIFVKDGFIVPDIAQVETGNSYKKDIKPSVPEALYDDAHLLFGNKEAKHKLLVFSDPMCPFCQEVVPAMMKAAQKHPETLALYYYHLPLLRIHPVSDVLTRVMHVAQHEGKLDAVKKIYKMKIDYKETDTTKILAAVKKDTGYVVSAEKIDAKEVREAIKKDEETASRMMVTGTPSIYVDGKWDKTRDGYKKLID